MNIRKYILSEVNTLPANLLAQTLQFIENLKHSENSASNKIVSKHAGVLNNKDTKEIKKAVNTFNHIEGEW